MYKSLVIDWKTLFIFLSAYLFMWDQVEHLLTMANLEKKYFSYKNIFQNGIRKMLCQN